MAYSGGQQVFSPYAAMGNSPGMMIDPNGEMTKYAEDLTAAENDWLMNSPERKAWNLGRNTGLNGAFRLLGHHPGSDMFMHAGGGGSKKGETLGNLSDEIGRILEGAKGDWSSISLQFDDLGLTGGYWLNGNYKDLYYADGILPPITLVRSLGGWHVTDLAEARAAIQISLMSGGNNSLGLLGSAQSASLLQAGLFGSVLGFTERHFNGSIGLVGYAAEAYNKIPNDIKRRYAYKLSKATGWKSGKIFQEAKAFSKSTAKIASKLGPYGTALTVGVIMYEVGTDTWDAHTIVNGALLIGGAAATFFAAPAVLTGIALYGIADYFFDFSEKIDSAVGRNSRIW